MPVLTEPPPAPATAQATETSVSTFDKLRSSAITNRETIAERKRLAKNAKFVLNDLALEGQHTVFYAAPNAGKTLLILWLLAHPNQELNDVYYLNADDDYDGGTEKAELAMNFGIEMIVPDQGDFEIEDFPALINELNETGKSRTTTIILDTLKKFAPLMDKTKAAAFGKISRSFIQAGGTLISLAHANKHLDGSGKVVFEGVGDIVSDADAAYTIEMDTPKDQADRQVSFEMFKSRGPNTRKVSFTYDAGDGVKWLDRFNSVRKIDAHEATRRAEDIKAEEQLHKDRPCIDYIVGRLQSGQLSRRVIAQEDLGNGFSRGEREKILDRYHDENPRPEHRFFKRTASYNRGFSYELN